MALPANRTWTITANNALDSGVDGVDQWQQMSEVMWATPLAAGWTVELSSNGVVADNTDNLTGLRSNFKLDTQGVGWWGVLKSPAGWADASGGFCYLLMYANTSSGDTTPQPLHFKMSANPYTGGTTSTLPTLSAGAEVGWNTNIVGWNAPIPGNYLDGYSTRGDWWILQKGTGQDYMNFGFAMMSNSDLDGGGEGDLRFFAWYASSNGDIFQTSASIHNTYRGLRRDGLLSVTPTATSIVGTILNGITNGVGDLGHSYAGVVHVVQNTGADGRYMGQLVDVYSCPQNLGFGEVDDSESAQDPRRVCMKGVWWYVPAAALPLL